MVDTPKENHPNSDWPDEVKQAYEHLKIPSLYDAVIANEKLSFEIRRQDRELKNITEGVQQLSVQMNTLLKIMEEEEYELVGDLVESPHNGFGEDGNDDLTDLELQLLQENQDYLEQQSEAMLMNTHDDMWDLSYTVKRMMQQAIELLPKTEGIIPHKPVWHPVLEGIIQNVVESVERCRYQLLARLKEMSIDLINPQPGENVNTSFHRVVDHLAGGKVETIARVVRVGYTQNQEVLRLADVTVYH